MEWRDEGIILGTRRHGETSVILEAMTRTRGRHMGLVRGGRSRRLQPLLQPGNRMDLVWRARLDEQLGTFQAEPIEQNAARLFGRASAVFGLQTIAAHLRLLPERDPHPELYEMLALLVAHLDDPALAGELVVRFELRILEELGFGLDLDACASTGLRADLAYVSPKSGRAVSRAAGSPWQDRLLALPDFLQPGPLRRASQLEVELAFRLTGHFFARNVYEPRGLTEPEARAAFRAALVREWPIGGERVA
jgi:DNA repair protein RecO (recombination protein O)